ncbi:MAG TPA: EAL domain-containing protein [Egibacteraceae bacterium]|nr:EAL domain-containing protein [Egibacteraceae bacterium]
MEAKTRPGARRRAGRPLRMRLRPPDGLLASLRWVAMFFGLANLALSLPVITLTNAASAPEKITQGGGLAATIYLTYWWINSYRRKGFTVLDDLLAGVGLLGIGAALGSPARALGLFAAAMAFRALYGTPVRIMKAAAIQAGAFAVAMASAPESLAATSRTLEIAIPAGMLLLAAPVLNAMSTALRTHERAARRARVLVESGAALLAVSDRSSIGTATLDAAQSMVGREPGTGVGVAVTVGDELVVVAATGTGVAPRIGARLRLSDLSAGFRGKLDRGLPFSYSPPPVEGSSVLRLDGPNKSALVTPLCSHGVVRGLIVITGHIHRDRDDCDCHEGLQTLAAQVSLALESAALNEGLARSEVRFRSLVQNASDIITVINAQGVIRYQTPGVGRVLGYEPGRLADTDLADLVHPEDMRRWKAFLSQVADRKPAPLSCRLRHRDGRWLHTEIVGSSLLNEPSVAGIVLSIRDISDRKALEEELAHRAFHDPLTNLPNRTVLIERVRQALGDSKVGRLAVLFIDLDGFKDVNDRLGHAAGDGLLITVAERLQSCLRPGDMAARLAGDEFAVVLESIADRADASAVAGRILKALGEPCVIRGKRIVVEASIGLAISELGVEDAEDLLHHADLAMYMAKAQGKGQCAVFEPSAYASAGTRQQLRSELQHAIAQGELELRYQPIVALDSGTIHGGEALVRWRHPTRGLLPPSAFVCLAQEAGHLEELFSWIVTEACTQALHWNRDLGLSHQLSVSVNVSSAELLWVGLVRQVDKALSETGLAPQLLTLEITEQALVANPQASTSALADLRRLGVQIAIDDFGAGASPIGFLRLLPIDTLKLDGAFVDPLEADSDTPGVITDLISLGRRLGVTTVAEGVERLEQRRALVALGCQLGQGHLFSRPLRADKFESLAAKGSVDVDAESPILSFTAAQNRRAAESA